MQYFIKNEGLIWTNLHKFTVLLYQFKQESVFQNLTLIPLIKLLTLTESYFKESFVVGIFYSLYMFTTNRYWTSNESLGWSVTVFHMVVQTTHAD